MCGICGYLGIDNAELIEKMKNTLIHRGPDGEGTYFDKASALALGHRRLSIIDLTEQGAQPMISQDGQYVLTYNGEIYNYIELREELSKLGHKIHSKSDTEVLLHAYIQWGDGCLAKLNGMFAFAIWNQSKRELFCARDRYGIKPFYYYYNNEKFFFASEIKALLAYGGIPRIANASIVRDFLLDGLVEHTNETFFQDIFKLMPGCYATVSAGKFEIQTYYQFEVYNHPIFDSDAADRFHSLFFESVNRQLRSDVDVASCLSGGLDSSSIVCAMDKLLTNRENRIQTFSSCFEKKRYDERVYIREVVDQAAVQAHYVFPSSEQLREDFAALVYHQEEPFLGTSIFAQWILMKEIHQHGIKVVLDGQGADEQLCGYRKYKLHRIRELLRERKVFDALVEAWCGLLQTNLSYNVKRDIQRILRFFKSQSSFAYADFLSTRIRATPPAKKIPLPKSVAETTRLDITCVSLPALIRYEDKNSMAFSVESRVPFLDNEFVDFVATLPTDRKMHRGWSKWVLRQGMRGVLPEKIRNRRSKMGFATSEREWLCSLRNEIKAAFDSDHFRAGGFIDQKKVTAHMDSLLSGRIEGNIFRLFVLETWMQAFDVESSS